MVPLNVRIPITIERVEMSNFIKKFVGISSNTSSSRMDEQLRQIQENTQKFENKLSVSIEDWEQYCEGPPPGPTPTEGATHHCGTPSRLTVSCPGLSPWLTCSCPSGTSHFRISGQIPIDHFFRLRESSILRAKEI